MFTYETGSALHLRSHLSCRQQSPYRSNSSQKLQNARQISSASGSSCNCQRATVNCPCTQHTGTNNSHSHLRQKRFDKPLCENFQFHQVFVQIEYGLVIFLHDLYDLPHNACFILTTLGTCTFFEPFPLLTLHFLYRCLSLVKWDNVSI